MSVFQCEACGCAENTALCNYWYEHVFLKGPKLCSACTEIELPGKLKGWHDRFERTYLPKGMFITDRFGNLVHKHTKEPYHKYALPGPE